MDAWLDLFPTNSLCSKPIAFVFVVISYFLSEVIGEPKQIAFLGHDDNRDVADYVGYAYRKLGDYDLSKVGTIRDSQPIRTMYGRGNIAGLAARAGKQAQSAPSKRSGSCAAT
jgi:hypothetical protein